MSRKLAPPIVAATAILLALMGIGCAGDAERDASAEAQREQRTIRIDEDDLRVVGGVRTYTVRRGTRMRIVVSSDRRYMVHMLGYDVYRVVKPGHPAELEFVANVAGRSQIESHGVPRSRRYRALGWLNVEP